MEKWSDEMKAAYEEAVSTSNSPPHMYSFAVGFYAGVKLSKTRRKIFKRVLNILKKIWYNKGKENHGSNKSIT